jgi:hypothetical protein
MLLFSLGFIVGLMTIPVTVIILGIAGVRYMP